MNNTEKKLDALIDALGFDVEEIGGLNCHDYAQHLMDVGGVIPVNASDYRTTEYKFTKRDEPVVNPLAGIFGKCSHVNPSTLLKRELLVILEKAGKKPKRDTIAIIEHAIDKAFKNE
jgi:hypothetical protein